MSRYLVLARVLNDIVRKGDSGWKILLSIYQIPTVNFFATEKAGVPKHAMRCRERLTKTDDIGLLCQELAL